MRKYMCTHSLPPEAFTPEQICRVAEAAQRDENVRGYRSFFNLTEGKAWCILESEDRQAIVDWLQRIGIPHDSIVAIELEGDRGVVEDLRQEPAMAGVT